MIDISRYENAGMASGRAPAVASDAMVVAPGRWATLVGLDVLRAGGSAVDAAIAVGAALVVEQPQQCGLGGDSFWLVRKADGDTEALNSSGRAPTGADADGLRERGLTAIPPRSGAAVTVPGMVAGWISAHQRHGRLDFARLLAPAIRGAEGGIALTALSAWYLQHAADVLAARPETSRIFTNGGVSRRTGDVVVQPDLAATLRALATDPSAFYRGRLAEAVATAIREEGGWMTPDDLAAHRSEWVEPVRAPFAGWMVEEMPPNSQGLAALIGLTLLAGGGLPDPEDEGAWLDRGVSAARVLMAVRDAEIADPGHMRRAPHELLDDEYLDPLRALVGGPEPLTRGAVEAVVGAAPQGRELAPRGDTVHFSIVDADGLAVSCIQSVFDSFGSGIVVPGTGILLHNRATSFTLDPGHVNALEPGKRPMHTLAPGMATAGGRTAAVFGCMGGHAQAQIHVQIVGALAGQGMDPAAALERPRWSVPFEDPDGDAVDVEDRGSTARALEARGHRVRRVAPFAQEMGHAQVILVDHETGALIGAADPRSDGLALGY